MEWIIGIDPGYANCGFALIGGGQLVHLNTVSMYKKYRNINDVVLATELYCDALSLSLKRTDDCAQVVIEYPVIYSKLEQKGDPNHVLNLATVAGALAQYARKYTPKRAVLVTPRNWKGQESKEATLRKLKKRYPIDLYLKNIVKTKQEHAVDALGVATWWLERGKVDHEEL